MPPLKIFLSTSAVASFLARQALDSYTASSSLVWLFMNLFFLQCLLWTLWYWLVYPKLFSPLRNFPHPDVSAFTM